MTYRWGSENNTILEEYKCKYDACPFCNWGVCTGDKEIAIKNNFCYKEKYGTLQNR